MFLEFLETLLVGVLFIIYLLLWRTKRMIQKKKTGIDPEVIAKSKSNLQSLMNIMFNIDYCISYFKAKYFWIK